MSSCPRDCLLENDPGRETAQAGVAAWPAMQTSSESSMDASSTARHGL